MKGTALQMQGLAAFREDLFLSPRGHSALWCGIGTSIPGKKDLLRSSFPVRGSDCSRARGTFPDNVITVVIRHGTTLLLEGHGRHREGRKHLSRNEDEGGIRFWAQILNRIYICMYISTHVLPKEWRRRRYHSECNNDFGPNLLCE